ncbi:MAG TPA: polysaccharide lyase, partial [Candidatus Paceibacterota bacterium]|nr:polysaccharide lyase [Candidatus Paceibacterota bacterium]
MTLLATYQKRIAVFVMVIAMSFGFFLNAQAANSSPQLTVQKHSFDFAYYQTDAGFRALLLALITELKQEIERRQATSLGMPQSEEMLQDKDGVSTESVIAEPNDESTGVDTAEDNNTAVAEGDGTASVTLVSTETNIKGPEGVFVLEVDVTAVDGAVRIPNDIDRATKANQDYLATDSDVGFWYGIYNGTNPRSHFGTFTASVDTTAASDKGDFVVPEGETEKFTIQLNYAPEQAGEYRITLMALIYNTDEVLELTPAWNFRTEFLEIKRGELGLDLNYEEGELAPAGSGVTVTAPGSDAAKVVKDVVRAGEFAARYALTKDDEMVDGGTRSESHAINCKACRYTSGDTSHYAFSVYIPEGWVNDGVYSDFVFQWHSAPDYALGESGKNPNIALAMKRNDFVLRITHDDSQVSTADSVTKEQVTVISDVESGWHDFVFKIDWSYENDGLLQVWHKLATDTGYQSM